jgi:excisionase family DNA binding protein
MCLNKNSGQPPDVISTGACRIVFHDALCKKIKNGFQANVGFKGGFKVETDQDEYIYLPVMTVSEAAKYLGVGKKIIYQLIEFGEIRAVRDRGAVMVEKLSLDNFRNSGKRF